MLIANFIITIGELLSLLCTIYIWMIFLAIAFYYFQPNPENPIVRIVTKLTEPSLSRARKLGFVIRNANIDLSPTIVIFVVYCIKNFIARSIIEYGLSL